LLVALEHRNDPRLAWIVEHLSDGCNVLCLLGSDWHGHRRTYPVLERWPVMYWYQWFDRGLPWIAMQREQRLRAIEIAASSSERSGRKRAATKRTPTRVSAGASAASPVPLRVQWILQQSEWLQSALRDVPNRQALAWIISDSAEQQEMWLDAFRGLGVRGIATRERGLPPRIEPEWIVIDRLARAAGQPSRRLRVGSELIPIIRIGGESGSGLVPWVAPLRREHPRAFLTVVESFPDPESWSEWRHLGVDAVVPRPCHVDGLVWTWLQTADAIRDSSPTAQLP
jgi:hypothetical protein